MPPKQKKMDPTFKQLWLEALRSGKYKQGQGRLRDRNSRFCCLGVLSDVVCPIAWRNDIITWPDNDGYYLWSDPLAPENCQNASHDLSPELCLELGLTSDQTDTLIEMNDEGCSFAEIADYIQENL